MVSIVRENNEYVNGVINNDFINNVYNKCVLGKQDIRVRICLPRLNYLVSPGNLAYY